MALPSPSPEPLPHTEPCRMAMPIAVAFHIWRREPFIIQLTIVPVAAFVAWGRATWQRGGATP